MPPIQKPPAKLRSLTHGSPGSNGRAMPLNEDPLERAERIARELADADDNDEPTTPDIHVTVNVPREPSRPEIEIDATPTRREIHAGLKVLGAAVGIGLLTGAATLLQQCH
jgi:hypothetical protein